MLQTSPIILTSLKLKPTTNNKNEVLLHAINVEARKDRDTIHLWFGAPAAFGKFWCHKHELSLLHDFTDVAVSEYNFRNRVNTTIEKGEVERIQKLLV